MASKGRKQKAWKEYCIEEMKYRGEHKMVQFCSYENKLLKKAFDAGWKANKQIDCGI